ncbi:MAG: LysM peptidoglycan-binding domain-containing protein [Hyphomonadaceae bacterium]|nr:LysM peptidoglycan-binding domain-containing protein [Hyphomonadaceae bacterium]
MPLERAVELRAASLTASLIARMYTVRAGDTLSSIAAALWGDASLWYKLAEVNGLTGESALIEGQPLIVPVGVVRSENNATTFKPYDPLEVLGNTSPTAPKPHKQQCGGMGAVLIAVVAIAVVVVMSGGIAGGFSSMLNGGTFGQGFAAGFGGSASAGAAAGAQVGALAAGNVAASGLAVVATGSITAGAVAGAATAAALGSIVSQGIGVATGIQDKFSWNAVALAAIAGGIGGSGSQLGVGGSSAMSNALRQGVANAITQGIGVATGLQRNFSWAGVAAAAVGSYASARAPAGPLNIVRSGASLIADAATRSLIEGSDFGDNVLAALPNVIGQTIGEAIAGGIAGRGRAVVAEGNGGPAQKRGQAKELLPQLSPESRAELARLFGEGEAGTSAAELAKLRSLLATLGRRAGGALLAWAIPTDADGGVERIGVPEFEDDHLILTRLKSEAPGQWSIAQTVNPWTGEPVNPGDWIKEFRVIGGAIDRGDGLLVVQDPQGIADKLGHPLVANVVVPMGADGDDTLGFGVVVQDQDELDLVGNLRAQGRNSNEINSELALFRVSRGGESGRPGWLQRVLDGVRFDREQGVRYPYNQVYIDDPSGGYRILDSYNPEAGEIVSRKLTQLWNIAPETAIGYITEAATKYAVGRTIANVPTARDRYPGLIGRQLLGQVYLEVPVQTAPVPPVVLSAAAGNGVIIRDVEGNIYRRSNR